MMTQFEFVQAVAIVYEKLGGRTVKGAPGHVLEKIVAPLVAMIAAQWPGEPLGRVIELSPRNLGEALRDAIKEPGFRAGNARELIGELELVIDELTEKIARHEKPATQSPRAEPVPARYSSVPAGVVPLYTPRPGDRVRNDDGRHEFTVGAVFNNATEITDSDDPFAIRFYASAFALIKPAAQVKRDAAAADATPTPDFLATFNQEAVAMAEEVARREGLGPEYVEQVRAANGGQSIEASVDEAAAWAATNRDTEPEIDAEFEVVPDAGDVIGPGCDESLLEAITGEKPAPSNRETNIKLIEGLLDAGGAASILRPPAAETRQLKYGKVPEGVGEDYEPYTGDVVSMIEQQGSAATENMRIVQIDTSDNTVMPVDSNGCRTRWIEPELLELITPARTDIEDD